MTRHRTARSLAGTVLVALASVTALHAAPAHAQNAVPVTFNRSELSSDEGIARVYQQLRTAARAACGEDQLSDVQDVDLRIRFQTCVRDAVARAVADVHDQRLSAYLQHKTGAPQRLAAIH
jgi:UrcA family protein